MLKGDPIRISKVVGLAAISDLARSWREKLCYNVVEHFLGGSPEAVPDRYRAASPSAQLPLGVPQVLFHGDQDRLVPLTMSEHYADAARQAGDSVSLRALPGADHFDLIDPRGSVWPRIRAELLDEPVPEGV